MLWQKSEQYANMPWNQYLQTEEGQRYTKSANDWQQWQMANAPASNSPDYRPTQGGGQPQGGQQSRPFVQPFYGSGQQGGQQGGPFGQPAYGGGQQRNPSGRPQGGQQGYPIYPQQGNQSGGQSPYGGGQQQGGYRRNAPEKPVQFAAALPVQMQVDPNDSTSMINMADWAKKSRGGNGRPQGSPFGQPQGGGSPFGQPQGGQQGSPFGQQPRGPILTPHYGIDKNGRQVQTGFGSEENIRAGQALQHPNGGGQQGGYPSGGQPQQGNQAGGQPPYSGGQQPGGYPSSGGQSPTSPYLRRGPRVIGPYSQQQSS